jgi:3-isopropylmalate dehydratase small subunit
VDRAAEGETVEIDFSTGVIRLAAHGVKFSGSRLPDFLLKIIEDGGLVNHLLKSR